MSQTYEQLLLENQMLKAQLRQLGKIPRDKFVFPEELGKKYFSPDYETYNTEAMNIGRFISVNDINHLSLVIRTVLFENVTQIGKTKKGKTVAKNINDLTDQEYKSYVSCLDDFMYALKRRLPSKK